MITTTGTGMLTGSMPACIGTGSSLTHRFDLDELDDTESAVDRGRHLERTRLDGPSIFAGQDGNDAGELHVAKRIDDDAQLSFRIDGD